MATREPGSDESPTRARSSLHGDGDGRGAAPPARQWTLWDAIKPLSLRNLVFALVLGLVGAVGGAAVALSQEPIYSSKATLIIDQPAVLADASDEGAILKMAFLKVKYADLAKSPAIAGPAADSVDLTRRRLTDNVVVTTSPQNLLLTITGQGSTAERSQRIANAVGQAIIDYADEEQQALNLPEGEQYEFSFVQRAEQATKLRPTLNRAIQAALGLGVLGVGLAYVILQLLTARKRGIPSGYRSVVGDEDVVDRAALRDASERVSTELRNELAHTGETVARLSHVVDDLGHALRRLETDSGSQLSALTGEIQALRRRLPLRARREPQPD